MGRGADAPLFFLFDFGNLGFGDFEFADILLDDLHHQWINAMFVCAAFQAADCLIECLFQKSAFKFKSVSHVCVPCARDCARNR